MFEVQDDQDSGGDGPDVPRAEGDLAQVPVVLQPGVALFGAGPGMGVGEVEGPFVVGEVTPGWSLDRAGKAVTLAFVAQVDQNLVAAARSP